MGTIETNEPRAQPNRRVLLAALVAAWAVIVVLASAAYFSTGGPGPSFGSALTGPIKLLGGFRVVEWLYVLVPFLAAVVLVVWGIWGNGCFRVALGSILGALVWVALSLVFAFLHCIA